MELKDKKVNFLGDSITEGVGVSSPDKRYVNVFESISGAKVRNYGISGTRIARQRTKSATESFDLCFLDRVDTMEDADVVVVFGGTNDFGHGDSTIGDISSHDEYTFYGAMHSLCNRLINKFPYAEIVFMTPLHRISENEPVNEIGIKHETFLDGYVEIIKEVAGLYGLPVLDLFNTSGLQPKVDVIKEKYMPDGLHPSDMGAKRIADRLYGFLKAL